MRVFLIAAAMLSGASLLPALPRDAAPPPVVPALDEGWNAIAVVRDASGHYRVEAMVDGEPVDFLIGNTYGKYLERDTGTPLIRIGFPIFDRHHHHRYPVWGYQGGLNVLVKILDKIFDTIDAATNVPAKTDYSFDIIR